MGGSSSGSSGACPARLTGGIGMGVRSLVEVRVGLKVIVAGERRSAFCRVYPARGQPELSGSRGIPGGWGRLPVGQSGHSAIALRQSCRLGRRGVPGRSGPFPRAWHRGGDTSRIQPAGTGGRPLFFLWPWFSDFCLPESGVAFQQAAYAFPDSGAVGDYRRYFRSDSFSFLLVSAEGQIDLQEPVAQGGDGGLDEGLGGELPFGQSAVQQGEPIVGIQLSGSVTRRMRKGLCTTLCRSRRVSMTVRPMREAPSFTSRMSPTWRH